MPTARLRLKPASLEGATTPHASLSTAPMLAREAKIASIRGFLWTHFPERRVREVPCRISLATASCSPSHEIVLDPALSHQ